MRIRKNFKNSLKNAGRKSSVSRIARKRVVHARSCKRRRFSKHCSKQVSDKLEALKSLIPRNVRNGSNYEIDKAEQLFQETADYIVVLKTQVFVLQKLIEFYDDDDDGSKNVNQNHVQEDQS
ncbi:hypothetical protein DITRI_Ditri09bG0055100 [Diplodiscus trichospermus]